MVKCGFGSLDLEKGGGTVTCGRSRGVGGGHEGCLEAPGWDAFGARTGNTKIILELIMAPHILKRPNTFRDQQRLPPLSDNLLQAPSSATGNFKSAL